MILLLRFLRLLCAAPLLAAGLLALVVPSAQAASTVNLSFSPPTINPGDQSTVSVAIYNSGFTPLTSVAMTINLASGVTIAASPVVNDSCGFTTASAPGGGTRIVLDGGDVPAAVPGGADGSCTFTVNVTSTGPGNHTTTLPSNGPSNGFTPGGTVSGYQADDGIATVTNGTAASATLAVNSLTNPTGSLAFSPTTVYVGETSTLTLTLANPNAGVTLPLTTVTNSLPAGMSLASSSGTVNCTGTGAANGTLSSPSVPGALTVGDTAYTLSGGTIGSGGSCTVSVTVKASTSTGSSTDSIAANGIGNTRGLGSAAFSASLTANNPVSVSQSTTPSAGTTVRAGQAVTLRLTIGNASSANALVITSFTDNLASGLVVNAGVTPAVSCTGTGAVNGTVTATPGTNQVVLSGATAGRSGSCVVTVGVSMNAAGSLASTSATTVVAGTQMSNAAVSPANLTVPSSNVSVTAASAFTVAKSVSNGTAYQGQPISYTVTISNWSAGAAGNVSFTDTLPTVGGVPMLLAAGSALGAGCSGGTFTATAGTSGVTWTGGTVASGTGTSAGTCTITIQAAMPATATIGAVYTNSLAANTSVTGTDIGSNAIANTNSASAGSTTSASVTVAQTLTPSSTIVQGGTTTLRITLTNPTAADLTNLAFAETLNSNVTIAAGATSTTCTGTPVISATAGGSAISVSGLTVPANGNCRVQVPVTSMAINTGSGWSSSIAAGAITDDQGQTNSSAASVVLKVSSALSASAAFSPNRVGLNGTTRYTLTLSNGSTIALTGIAVTDPLPSGGNAMVVADVPNEATTCGGTPVITAAVGATSVSMTGAGLAAGASCTLSFDVTTSAGSSWTNTIPAGNITSTETATNASAVSASATNSLTASAAFSPTSTGLNGNSRVTLTISNAGAVAFTNLSVTSPMQTGGTAFTLAASPGAITTCAGSPSITAVGGATSIGMTGATLAAGTSCALSFDITTTAGGPWTYTLAANAITTAEGAKNSASATASLSKVTGTVGINKSFSPISIVGGNPATLQIDLTNPVGGSTTVNGVGVVDTFPSGMEVFSVPNARTTCTNGVVSATSGGGSVTLSGADIAVGTTCSVYVDVTSVMPLNLTNTLGVGIVTSRQGFTNTVATSASLSTLQGVGVEIGFAPAAVAPSQVSRLTLKLVSTLNAVSLSGVAVTNTLPAGVVLAASPNFSSTCNVGASGTGGSGTITISGVALAAQANCTIGADVVAASTGSYTDTIPVGGVTSNESYQNQTASSATLQVLSAPTVGLAFSPTSIASGGTSTLTFTVTNTSAQTLSGLALTGTLPAGLTVALVPAAATTCTSGSVAATAAGSSVALSGASLNAGSSCTFRADVGSNTAGSYAVTVPVGAITTPLGVTNAAAATATLGVLQFPTVGQALSPSTIAPGGTTAWTLTLGNANASAITLSSALTINLPGSPGPLQVASPNGLAKTCPGTVTAVANATSITYANGASIPSGGCTITVNLTASTLGTYVNAIAAGALQTSAGNSQTGSSVSLVVSNSTPPVASAVGATINSDVVTPQAVGPLSATATAPATVTTYTLRSLPNASLGTLYCNGSVVASVPQVCGAAQVAFLPVTGAGGTTTFTYTATDSNGNLSAAATGTIVVNQPPVASALGATVNNTLASAAAVGPLSATAQPGATIAGYAIASLPGASLNVYCSGARVSSVPTACAAGQLTVLPVGAPTSAASFTYTATDSNGMTSAAAMVTVNFNQPPVASALSATINNNAASAVAVGPLAATAQAGATIASYAIASLPGASLNVYCSGTRVTSVPTACTAGQITVLPVGAPSVAATFTYTATDSNGMSSAAATVTVNFNQSPVASAVSATINNNAASAAAVGPLSATAQAGATIASYAIASLPGASLNVYCSGTRVTSAPSACAAGQLTVLPVGAPSATATFTYTATDSNGMSSAPATVTVAFNQPPTAAAVVNANVNSNVASPVALSAMVGTAVSPGATVTAYTVVSLPTQGTLFCGANALSAVPTSCAAGGLRFQPAAATPNPVTFTYTVTDSNGMASSAAVFSIPLNGAPTAAPLSTTINNNAATPVAVGPLSATPQTGATIASYAIASLPGSSLNVYCSGMRVTSVPTACGAGQLTVLPVGAPSSAATFTYTATDSNGMTSAAATVTVNVNQPPVATGFTVRVLGAAGQAQALPAMNATARTAGATVVAYQVVSLPSPALGALRCNGSPVAALPSACAAASLTVVPSAGASGTATFGYTATDSNGMVSDTATVTLVFAQPPVAQPLALTVANPDSGAVPLPFTVSGSTATTGATLARFTVTALPASGSLSCRGTPVSAVPADCAADGLSYLPAPGTSGSVTLRYTVTDSDGLVSAPANVVIALQTPPLAQAIEAGPLDNASVAAQPLPSLAGSVTTPGATLVRYTLTTLPAAGAGQLLCDAAPVTTVPWPCAPLGLSLRVAAAAEGTAEFRYTVTDSNGLVSAPATVRIALAGSPALTIRKTSAGPMTVGFETRYTLLASNRAPHTATRAAVTVSDTLPDGLDFVAAGGDGWTCGWTDATRTVACRSERVIPAAGDAAPIMLTVRPNAQAVASGATARIVNTARVAGGGEADAYANGTAAGAQPHTSTDTQTVQAAASVSGVVWLDLNANGTRDSGEPLLDAGTVRVEAWPAGTSSEQATAGAPLASVLIDAAGQYALSVPPGDIQVRFVNVSSDAGQRAPVLMGSQSSGRSGVIDHVSVAPGARVERQDMPVDPQGFVYDAGTRQPVGGATVTLRAGGVAVPLACLGGGANPYVTAATGAFAGGYQFLVDFGGAGCAGLAGATFTLDVAAAGYRFPSTLIPAGEGGVQVLRTPAGGGGFAVVAKATIPTAEDPTTHYLAMVLAPANQGVVNNHIPLDGTTRGALAVSKQANKALAEIGDLVRYTVTLRNTGNGTLPAITLADQLPLGFRLVPRSATLQAAGASRALDTAADGAAIRASVPGLAPGSVATVSYVVRIGVGADKGDGINRVRATAGDVASAEATARVRVGGGVFGTDACVAGKVYLDCNGNGQQDDGEPGVSAVRLWLESGVSMTTDADGRFAWCGITPRTHSLRIDPATLPPGLAPQIGSVRNLGDAGSLLLSPRAGELSRADFPLRGAQCGVPPREKRPAGPPGWRPAFESSEQEPEVRHD